MWGGGLGGGGGPLCFCVFFFNDTATTEIYTLSLHDALPILDVGAGDGTLIEAFRRHGRDAVGVDPYASGDNPHIRAVQLEDMNGGWSAVVFWHSLEHLRRPVRSLRHAAGLVVPGGVLV